MSGKLSGVAPGWGWDGRPEGPRGSCQQERLCDIPLQGRDGTAGAAPVWNW